MQPNWIIRDEEIRARLMVAIAQLDLTHPWEVTIKPYRKRRSLSQNALYHAEVSRIAKAVSKYTGYSHEQVHEFLKQKFLEPEIIEIGGECHERWTTKNLSAEEMSDYVEQVRAWASHELSELGIYEVG